MPDTQRDATLETIRGYLARTTGFDGVAPGVAVLCGGCGVAAALSQAFLGFSFADKQPEAAIALWLVTLVFTAGLYWTLTLRKHLRLGGKRFTAPARLAYSSTTFGCVCAGLISLALYLEGASVLLPATWLACYAIIVFPLAFVAGRAFHLVALVCLTSAGASLALPDLSTLWLGMGFGGGHLVMAGMLMATRRTRSTE